MENNKETNPKIKKFIDRFEDKMETAGQLTDEERSDISSEIDSQATLVEGLKMFKEMSSDFKTKIETCDKNTKIWQESKKEWKNRDAQFSGLLEAVMVKLAIASARAGNIKLSTSKRTCLEVDDQWLLGQYEPFVTALQAQLPSYIKVSLSLDKNALSAFLKNDSSMLVNYPDKIHTKTSTSTTIK